MSTFKYDNNMGRSTTDDGKVVPVTVDPYTSALNVIDAVHANIHKGIVYHASQKGSVANGASMEMLIVVPANTYPHLHRFRTNVEAGDIDAYFFEGTTVSANGVAIDAININRNSSNVADLDIYSAPTITGDGTQLGHHWIPPSGTGVGNTVGILDVSTGEEWILKPSTNYLIRMTNNSGGTIEVWAEALWYE